MKERGWEGERAGEREKTDPRQLEPWGGRAQAYLGWVGAHSKTAGVSLPPPYCPVPSHTHLDQGRCESSASRVSYHQEA